MHGFQILLELCLATAELISALYFILATLLRIQYLEADTNSDFIGLMTAWLFMISFKLIGITAPCQSATTQAENTAILVQKLLLVPRFVQDTMEELQLFSQQMFQSKMKFYTFGFLNLY
jgi:hypothetical protein